MAGFTDLPSEIVLKVLRTLRIPDIHAFGLVCKHFDAVIKDNSSSVYRLAALSHGYISNPSSSSTSSITLLEQSKRELYGNQTQINLTSWLEYCMHHLIPSGASKLTHTSRQSPVGNRSSLEQTIASARDSQPLPGTLVPSHMPGRKHNPDLP